MNWHPETHSYLVEKNYVQLANYYENLIEKNPNLIDNYLYLGLAYLLQKREEEAQLTWLLVFNQQETESKNERYHLQKLIGFMEAEATRLRVNENYDLAWLVRGHIRELEPDNLINLMELLCLEIILQYPVHESIVNYNIVNILISKNGIELPESLIKKTLEHVLYIVCEESIDFARACLQHSNNSRVVVDTISKTAKTINLVHKLVKYPVDLINLCREKYPDDLILIRANLIFYGDNIKYYDKALSLAYEFLNNSQTISTQIFAFRQILYIYLKNYNWDESIIVAQNYIESITKFIQSPQLVVENFIASTIPMLPHHCLMLRDNPQQNRIIFNQINKYFQNLLIELGQIGYQYSSYPNHLTKDRKLRIGYIGHTFKSHSVGWLCRWLMTYHDRQQFEVFIYSLTDYADEFTQHYFIENSHKFYSYPSTTYYEEIVQQIRDDAIDILIDLDSITLVSTCEVLVHKPAPIQITWLGLDASGIPAIDYFIADPYALPRNAQEYYSEKIWRLPHTYLGIDGFEIGTPTVTRESLEIEPDAIVFMNSQGPLKLHPDILKLQLQIIKNVPHSYLVVKGNQDHRFLGPYWEKLTAEIGVNMNRLRFIAKTPTEAEHRANLSITDVMLDTYPYNGATTTLETLWMEIPLVTRVGEQFAARNSYTFMINAGITEGIAWTDEEYVEWGIKLGTDENLRKEISWKLRQSKKTSPLWDGKQFARDMENAYRQMWEIYVQENQAK